MKKKSLMFVGFFAVFVLLFFATNAFFVSAQFSVSTTHSDNFPLSLKPGEAEGVFFRVKHVDETIGKMRIEVIPGESEIAEFLGEERVFEINYNEEFRVPVRVQIPDNAEIGTEYEVSALFRTIESEGGAEEGNVQFTISIGKDFPVAVVSGEEVAEEIEQEEIEEAPAGGEKVYGNIIFFLILSILVVGVILVYYLIRREKVKIIRV